VAFEGYPPSSHILADLGMRGETTTGTTGVVRTRATPQVASADGGVRAGVLATLVDVVGGMVAARALRPERLATADLCLQVVGPVTGAWVEARASVLRRGRTTMVLGVLVVAADEPTGERRPGEPEPDPVAWATITFSVLPGEPTASPRQATEIRSQWEFGSNGLDVPVLEALGVTVVDPAAGRLSVPVRSYLHNSFQAVQGGVMAIIAEAAGAEAVGAALGGDASAVVVTDLQIAYLSLGRVGPIVSEARVLETGSAGGASAVVELRDAGADDRLATVVNLVAVPAERLIGAGR
jgi:uncharacterized protein (TIGR00369 family)